MSPQQYNQCIIVRMKVYFVRHGQSRGNKARIHQTGKDPLSEYGLKQAQTVASRFKKIPVDVIFSSAYTRAAQTAEAIGRDVHKTVIHITLLREMKRPTELEGKLSYGAHVTAVKNLLEDHAHDPDWPHSDEENLHDLINRAKKCLEFISARHEENIVVVSHGFFLRILISVMMFGPDEKIVYYQKFFNFFRQQNTGITVCT